MALSPNGKTLASGSYAGIVKLWDIGTRKVIAKWEVHTEMVESVCWSPDGERVASGFSDGTVWVWDVKSGEPVKGLNPIKTRFEYVFAVSYSPEATMIATGGSFKHGIEIWNAKTGKLFSTIEGTWAVWSLTWTSDQNKLITGIVNGLIRIFDTTTWQEIAVLDEHDDAVYSLTLFPNDRLLASSSRDQTVRLWNIDTNLPVGPPLQHEDSVNCVAFSANGKLLSTACHDENAYVWDVQAIFKTAGLENLLSIPHAQKSELNKKALSGANATRRPPIRPALCQVPAGFFDDVQGSDSPPATSHRHRRTLALSWGSHPRALFTRLPQLFRRSQTNADEPIESQQRSGPSNSSRRSPPVVEVPALDDKKALYTARPQERVIDKAKRIKNPTWLARVVLFICCVSPSTDDGH
jgi:WD40 repeat protein